MAITLELPPGVEETFRNALGPNVERAAFDALIIEGYRTTKLSTGDIADILGFETRLEAEQWLTSRGMRLNYSLEDLEDDRATLERVLGPVKH